MALARATLDAVAGLTALADRLGVAVLGTLLITIKGQIIPGMLIFWGQPSTQYLQPVQGTVGRLFNTSTT